MNEALRDWAATVSDTHYIIGSVVGPHPFPQLVRDLQRVIGDEARAQFAERARRRPRRRRRLRRRGQSTRSGCSRRSSARPACARSAWKPAAAASNLGEHCSSITQGQPGRPARRDVSYLLQDADGQVAETHSISAGLDYPGVGPEHAYLQDAGLAEYVSATDADALEGFQALARTEGILPALEPGHVIGWLLHRPLPEGRQGARVPVGTRRQGPRHGAAPRSGCSADGPTSSRRSAHVATAVGRAFVPYVTGGLPRRRRRAAASGRRRRRRRDRGRGPLLRSGDGRRRDPGGLRGRARGRGHARRRARDDRARPRSTSRSRVMTYVNPVLPTRASTTFLDEARGAGVAGMIVPDLPVDEAEAFAERVRRRAGSTPCCWRPRAPRRAACGDRGGASSGFVYCVATYGVTGARDELGATAAAARRAPCGRSPTSRCSSASASARPSRRREACVVRRRRGRRERPDGAPGRRGPSRHARAGAPSSVHRCRRA